MGTCISKCDCSCTRSSSVLPQHPQQQPPQPTIQDKLVILSSSPLPSIYPLAHSSSSSPVKPPPPSSPSLSSTPSTNTTSNRRSSITSTPSTLSNNVYASSSSSSSSSSSTSTHISNSCVSSELGRSFSDEFQWSNAKKHLPKPRRAMQPAPSQLQQKAPPVPHKKPPPRQRVAPSNTSSCPQLQRSFRKDQRIGSSTRTTSERECVVMSVDDIVKARCSSNNCNAKTHNRRPEGGRGGGRPHDSDKRKQRNEKVRQKKTESRVHHMMDVPALLADDQIVDRRGSSHREDSDNSLVALDCFIFL